MKRNPNKNYFNEYKILNDKDSEFYIINKKGEHFTVQVDTEDLYRLIKFNRSWNAKFTDGLYYACCCEYLTSINGKAKYKIHYLHRWILEDLEDIKDVLIDHENHDTLNNHKYNLRISNRTTNAQNRNSKNRNNRTGYRNVALINGKYVVQLQIDEKNIKFDEFDNPKRAGKLAEILREKYYGEFAGNGT